MPDKEEKPSLYTIREVKHDANKDGLPDYLGKKATIAGRASVGSGVLHTDRLSVFLQNDDLFGIEIYGDLKKAPIAEGDSVVATGILDHYQGVIQLAEADYAVIPSERKTLEPLLLRIRDVIGERFEGVLVRVRGMAIRKWTESYGIYITLKEDFVARDSVNVFLSNRHKTGIDVAQVEASSQLVITGVLGQYSRNPFDRTGYEIYPRSQDDIEIVGLEQKYLKTVLIIAGIVVLVSGAWVVSLRSQVRRRTKELRESEHRARSIFEGAKDAILVFGEDLRILNVNAAGEHLWQRAREEFIGHSITQFIENPKGNISDPIGSNIKSGRGEFEAVGIRTDGSKLALSIGLNTVPFGGRDHFVIVVRDVTERNKISEEREKLIKELQNALAKVRTLSGLLPICSSCKKIRDDSGYWKQVEEYLALETDVQFSHGICPDCLERLYPEVARNKRQRLSDALSPKPEQKDQK